MSADVVIRQARPEDAEGFVRAHEAAWNATIGPIVEQSLDDLMPFAARVAMYRSSIGRASDQGRAWVAERAGEIVGTAIALRESPVSVELRDLYVVPSAWGTGISGSLMSDALESVAVGAQDAFLWVGEANARARRFYEREGWTPDGESRTSQLGPLELRYRRPLASQ
jgi:GNAT superfamily N-acetyltransferase